MVKLNGSLLDRLILLEISLRQSSIRPRAYPSVDLINSMNYAKSAVQLYRCLIEGSILVNTECLCATLYIKI